MCEGSMYAWKELQMLSRVQGCSFHIDEEVVTLQYTFQGYNHTSLLTKQPYHCMRNQPCWKCEPVESRWTSDDEKYKSLPQCPSLYSSYHLAFVHKIIRPLCPVSSS